MTTAAQTTARGPQRHSAVVEAGALTGLTGTTHIPPFVAARDARADPADPAADLIAPFVTASIEIPVPAEVLADRLGTAPAAVVVAAHVCALGLLGSETEVSVLLGRPGEIAEAAPTSFQLTDDWATLIGRVAVTPAVDDPAAGRFLVRSEGVQLQLDDDRISVTMAATLRDTAGARTHLEHVRGAIAAAVADPAADVLTADLLTADDHAANTRLGTGETVDPLPHSLFEALEHRAAEHPDRPAILHRGAATDYRTLLDAVHTVHQAVVAAGIRPGQVVAVALDRDPWWIAAVLGVMRAGAVYLPIDPRDPTERRDTLVRRSAARLVVDRPESLGLVASAERIVLPRAGSEVPPAVVPAVREPDPADPAYVYFTSGSTGEPKGALCAHGGMDNHLWAKIRDFRITADDVVLQSAQTTFDISLWQFAAPLMVGATVLIADHAALLDVPITLQLLTEHGVSIAQVVPSYLAILLDHLQQPGVGRALPTLRCLSVTGEAISLPVTRRLFEVLPGITLINAYGATEASDDTTHEIMHRAPAGPSVPVGRPNINVVVHILDERDRPVPPGSVGEITFSGIMVGLGYLNDPERTADAFGPDPVLPGERLYRSGDYGRWLPNGSLQFHGRRDEQVKIAGIRLELGEIEYRLRSLPDVGEAAVVTVTSGDAKELAGFVTGAGPIDLQDAAERLRSTLPAAAVPTTLVQLESLPLNSNGKVDKKVLARIAADHLDRRDATDGASDPAGGPATVATRIRAAWAGALELAPDSLHPDSDFFALGGTSIRALRAVAAADRLFGIADLFGRPVLGELVALVEGRDPDPAHGAADTTARATAPSLLLPLTVPADPTAHLVFLPPAGASALIAREFAAALAEQHPRVRFSALQHPGQTVPVDAPLPTGADLVEAVAAELASGGDVDPALPVVLWGQGSGAATAIALGRRPALAVDSVFLASQPARDRRSVLRGNAVIAATPDAQLVERARAALAVDPGTLSAQDEQRLARVYRHELMQSALDLLDDGLGIDGAPATALEVPLVVIRALDDPDAATIGVAWPGATELVVGTGGALFFRTRPSLAASVVADRLSSAQR